MIAQTELVKAEALEQALRHDETSPAVARYLASQREHSALMAGFRTRVKAGEEVEFGPLGLKVKETVAVQWEKVFARVREEPLIAAAIGQCRAVQALLRKLAHRDRKADFVEVRTEVSLCYIASPPDSADPRDCTP